MQEFEQVNQMSYQLIEQLQNEVDLYKNEIEVMKSCGMTQNPQYNERKVQQYSSIGFEETPIMGNIGYIDEVTLNKPDMRSKDVDKEETV